MKPRSLRFILLTLCMLLFPMISFAAEQPPAADPALVSTLFPSYKMIEGIHTDDALRLIMEKENGERIFVGGTQDADGGWHCVESTPLPDGAILGVENFVTSLGIKGKDYYHAVTLSPFADGTWGVTLLYPEGDQPLIFMGQNWIATDSVRDTAVFGLHPWSDITAIDWSSLPAGAEEAVPCSAGDWALVANPNPQDRLNLRTEPSLDCRTRGKYYNGTPVKLLSGRSNGFVQVDILGVTGWMKEEFISYETSTAVIPMTGPQLLMKEEAVHLYEAADSQSPYTLAGGDFVIIGVVGDTWYHVWFLQSGLGGYVLQNELWAGNG